MKRKSIGAELVASMEEALAHIQGKPTGSIVHHPKVVPNEVRAAREKLNLTQAGFSDLIGVPTATLRKWEQGQRQPTGAARALLKVIAREPKAALRALAGGR